MVSTAKRCSAALAAVVFSLLFVFFPVTVHAATYNAASLNGKAYAVWGQGTPLAGTQALITATSVLGMASPWIGAIGLGMQVFGYLLETNAGGKVALVPSNGAVSANAQRAAVPAADLGQNATWTNGYPGFSNCNGLTSRSAEVSCMKSKWMSLYPTVSSCSFFDSGQALQINGTTTDGQSCGGVSISYSSSCPSGMSLYPDDLCHQTASSASQPLLASQLFPDADNILKVSPADVPGWSQVPIANQPTATIAPSGEAVPITTQPGDQPATIQVTPRKDGGIDAVTRSYNPTTNQTTIINQTINNLGFVTNQNSVVQPGNVSSAGSPLQFPTDYNREATQQQAVQKLDDIKTGAGAADAPNYQVDQKKIDMNQELKEKTDAIPGQYAGDKGNWFSWVWTPPVGQCEPWTNSIHGQTVTWDVCPYIAKIRDVVGYLFAIGTTWGVYLQLFRRED